MGEANQPDVAALELMDLESISRFVVVAEELNVTPAASHTEQPVGLA